MNPDVATYVLVHGAFAGGWIWRAVRSYLRSAGHAVETPTLTGLGERVHLFSESVDLETHICDIVNVLVYEDLQQVILVGASYGGMVITGVADRVPERLAHVYYVDAFVPHAGESMFDSCPEEYRVSFLAGVPSGGLVVPAGVHPVPEVSSRLTGHPVKTLTQPFRPRNTRPPAIPRTFLRCTDPLHPGLAISAARAQQEDGWRYCELATKHSAYVYAPRELADLLLAVPGVG